MVDVKTCCPKGSEPKLWCDYQYKGTVEKESDMDIYTTGTGNRTIILIPDIFGVWGGRTIKIADHFAEKGFFVIVPDIARGDWLEEKDLPNFAQWIPKFPWDKYQKDLSDLILPFLAKKNKDSSIGLIGFCYGSWYVFKACSSLSKFKCGVNCHPSLQVAGFFGEKEVDIAKAVNCTQLLLPAGNDQENVKEEGEITKILQEKFGAENSYAKTYVNMKHGWVPRADISVKENADGVDDALKTAVDYFNKHL